MVNSTRLDGGDLSSCVAIRLYSVTNDGLLRVQSFDIKLSAEVATAGYRPAGNTSR